MNYEFSEQEQQLIDRVSQAVQAVITGGEGGGRTSAGESRDIVGRLAGELASTRYTTAGIDPDVPVNAGMMAAMEAFAALAPEAFIPFEMSLRGVGRLLAVYGTGEQQGALLQSLQTGRKVGAVALCEETMNVVNDPLTTAGEREDEAVRVSGNKGWVIGGAVADVLAVVGRLDDGLGVFLVDRDAAGLEVTGYPDCGNFCPPGTCRLSLDDCSVPLNAVIGPIEEQRLLTDLRLWEDQILIAAATGAMGAALSAATTHAKNHRTGGKPVIAFQEVGFKLAELYTLVQTAQLMAYKAAWTAAVNDRESATVTHCAKVFCAEAAETVASGALSILANHGLAPDNPAAAAYQWAKFTQMAGTSIEISRMAIGDAVLK